MIVLMYVLVIALLATVGYLVVKKAVKKAIIEAHDEIEARGKQGQGSHGLCDCGRELGDAGSLPMTFGMPFCLLSKFAQ